MSAILFCKRLISRPKTYRSMCQVTQMIDSRSLMEGFFAPDPVPDVPDGMEVSHLRFTMGHRYYMADDIPSSYTAVNFLHKIRYKDYEDSEPVVSFELEGRDIRFEEHPSIRPLQFIYMNVHSLDPPSVSTCNSFLREFLRDHPKEQIARPFVSQMLLRGTIPDLSTFSIIIKSYCKHHTYQHVHEAVFTQMKALGVKPNPSFYKRLMEGVCAHFGSTVGYELLKNLRSSHRVQMPLSCYNAIVRSLCWKRMIGDVALVLMLIDVLLDMKQQRIFPDEKIYTCLLKRRGLGGESFLKAVGIGRQMFAKGIRVRAVSLLKPFPQWTKELDPYPLRR